MAHTSERTFHTEEFNVDVDVDVFEAIRSAINEVSDVETPVLTNDAGTKIIMATSTPKGRKPGDHYTIHRVTLEKMDRDEKKHDHVEFAIQALIGVMREIDTAGLHSNPTSQAHCLHRARKDAKHALNQLKQFKGLGPDT